MHTYDNYVPQWWVELDDELSWLFINRLSTTREMKVKRMGITEILRRIWLFSANKIKSSESFSKQPTQLIVELNSSLQHIIVTLAYDLIRLIIHSYYLYILLMTNTQTLNLDRIMRVCEREIINQILFAINQARMFDHFFTINTDYHIVQKFILK